MHALSFLQDLAIILVVAGFVTVLFHYLKQPVVLGYILAGFLVGPFTPSLPTVHDEHTIRLLSELGMILLMFSLGQHFSLRKLASVGATAVVASVLEIGLMVWLGYEIGRGFGWNGMDSLFLGALLSISSTTIIVKALGELGLVKQRFAELVFGVLIIEDILGIAMIALLSGIALTGSLQAGQVASTLGYLGLFLVGVLVVGLLAVPRVLRFVARFHSNEMLLVVTLGICFGVSLLAAWLGYSVALGAFLAGAIVAEARDSHRIESLIEPVRDMFSAVFFVAIGMLIDPKLLVTYAVPILVLTAAVVVGKIVACSLGAFLAGNDRKTSMRVGMSMAQIGEFSFIIAQLGLTLKVTSDFLYPIAVAVSVLTTLLTPYLIKGSDSTVNLVERVAPKRLLDILDLYHHWVVAALAPSTDERRKAVRAIVTKLVFQVTIDLMLIAGLFVGAGLVFGRLPLPALLPEALGGQRTLLWLAASILSLPMLVHAFGKMRALATVLAEIGVSGFTSREQMPRVRPVVAAAILTIGMTAAVLLLALTSLAVLPPWPVLLTLLAVMAMVLVLLWHRLSQIYSRAQLSLRETFAASQEHREQLQQQQHLTTLLKEAVLAAVPVGPGSAAVGKMISELQLRSRTGASIVGIDRGGQSIVNPRPDEEILDGDVLTLLGKNAHLEEARRLLTAS